MSKTKGRNSRGAAPTRKARKRGASRRAKSFDPPSPPKKNVARIGTLGCDAAGDLLGFARGRHFGTILADPPWQFTNKTGKIAPEHKRLSRYGTMNLDEIMALPIGELTAPTAHLYLS